MIMIWLVYGYDYGMIIMIMVWLVYYYDFVTIIWKKLMYTFSLSPSSVGFQIVQLGCYACNLTFLRNVAFKLYLFSNTDRSLESKLCRYDV